jgi:hypothetical protein
LFPNKKYSSLYKQIKTQYGVNLWIKSIKNKIIHISKNKNKPNKSNKISNPKKPKKQKNPKK